MVEQNKRKYRHTHTHRHTLIDEEGDEESGDIRMLNVTKKRARKLLTKRHTHTHTHVNTPK